MEGTGCNPQDMANVVIVKYPAVTVQVTRCAPPPTPTNQSRLPSAARFRFLSLKKKTLVWKFQAEAAAKAEAAATHAAAERTEALRRLRLAHDAEMRKAGRDVLRLERQLRLRPRVSLLLLLMAV